MVGVTFTPIVTTLLGVAGAIATGAVTWWLTEKGNHRRQRAEDAARARRQSGTIETSEAAELWEATKGLIDRLTQRLDDSERDISSLKERVDTLMDSNEGLRKQLEAAQQLATDLQREIARLLRANTTLTKANSHLQRMNVDLTDQVTHLSELLEQHHIDMKGDPT